MSKLAEAAEQFDFIEIDKKPQEKPRVKQELIPEPELERVPQAAKPEPIPTMPTVVDTSGYLPMGNEANTIIKWANMMAETKFYQKMIAEGGKNAVLAIFLAARELNIPPLQALNSGLYIVQGRVQLSAQMMGMLIRRNKHSIQKIVGTDTECTLRGKRADNGDTCEVTFTIQQAEKAGITKNPVWRSWPSIMLYNRCLSMLAKQLFPDAIGNAVVEGEVDEMPLVAQSSEVSSDVEEFIEKHNLLDEDSELSKFIDRIASTLSKERRQVIEDAARDEKKFLDSFENYRKKKK